MNDTSITATPDAGVVYTELENEEAVLLHLGNHNYYSLNATGAHIWRLLAEGQSLGQITQRLQTVFDVNDEQARESVRELVTELAAEDLVTLNGDPQTALG